MWPLTLFFRSPPCNAPAVTLESLNTKLDKIMSLISQFAEAQDAHNQVIDTALDGISSDVIGIKEELAKLLASGTISDEDKATLARLDAKTKSIADRLTALDDLTPPVVPTAEAPATEPAPAP